jgi:hypothetical protein
MKRKSTLASLVLGLLCLLGVSPALSAQTNTNSPIILTMINGVYTISNNPAQALLVWSNTPQATVVSNVVYYGVASRVYTNATVIGLTNQFVVSNLVLGQTYYFAVTAGNSAGLQSQWSPEAVYTPLGPPSPPTNLLATNLTSVILNYKDSLLDPLETWKPTGYVFYVPATYTLMVFQTEIVQGIPVD